VWLYMPKAALEDGESSPCSAATAVSTSRSDWRFQMLAQSATSNEKRLGSLYWFRAWLISPWMKRLCGAMPEPSMAERGAARWISSLVASPAPISRSPGRDSASSTDPSRASGPTLRAPLMRYDLASSSWKTSQQSLFEVEGKTLLQPTLPPSGTMRNGAVYARRRSALPTSATAGSSSGGTDPDLWPTPASSNPNDGEDIGSWETRRRATKERLGNGNGMGTPLAIAARKAMEQRWPTPSASDERNAASYPSHSNRNSPPLANVAGWVDEKAREERWPTPKATDSLHTTISPSELERNGLSLATATYLWDEAVTQPPGADKWSTPQAFDARGFLRSPDAPPPQGGEKNLREIANRWSLLAHPPSSPPDQAPSPSGEESSPDDPTSAQLWPTPMRRDERAGWLNRERVVTRQGPTLSDVAATLTESQLLNPRFVSWLLGLPTWWTVAGPPPTAGHKSDRSETASSPNAPLSPSPTSGTGHTKQFEEWMVASRRLVQGLLAIAIRRRPDDDHDG
jgi:hypothetical protein